MVRYWSKSAIGHFNIFIIKIIIIVHIFIITLHSLHLFIFRHYLFKLRLTLYHKRVLFFWLEVPIHFKRLLLLITIHWLFDCEKAIWFLRIFFIPLLHYVFQVLCGCLKRFGAILGLIWDFLLKLAYLLSVALNLSFILSWWLTGICNSWNFHWGSLFPSWAWYWALNRWLKVLLGRKFMIISPSWVLTQKLVGNM